LSLEYQYSDLYTPVIEDKTVIISSRLKVNFIEVHVIHVCPLHSPVVSSSQGELRRGRYEIGTLDFKRYSSLIIAFKFSGPFMKYASEAH